MATAVHTLRDAVTQPAEVVRRLISPEKRRVIKFAVVGTSGVVVNLAVVALLGPMLLAAFAGGEAGARVAFFCGIAVSIFTNFLMNDRWTWRDRHKGKGLAWFQRLGEFYLAASVAATVQFFIASSLRAVLVFESGVLFVPAAQLSLLTPMVVAILIATPLNYVVNHFWTFRDR